ncbi:unnamed protein product [Rhizophagus irregularis]|nr:unnamed protein product [Rhizophagus irregularis]
MWVLPYVAPEVLNKEPYTTSSDIYTLEICNGLRPEFGKGTPKIYKKLAYRCMNAITDQRPTAGELVRKDIKAIFEEADKEIPNISTTYEKNPDAIYTSRLFIFNNLSKPINSPIITSYLNEEDNKDCQDSQLLNLEVSNSLQSREIVDNEIVLELNIIYSWFILLN